MILRDLSHCPICDGSLDDLRLGEACPACGFRRGEETQTISQSSVSATALFVAGIALFLAAVAGEPVGNWEPLPILALSACVLLTWRVITGRRRKAVLGSEGFILLGREERLERFTWNEVRLVRLSAAGNAVELVSETGDTINTIEIDFFGSPHRAEKFIAAAAEWAKHNTPPPPDDEGAPLREPARAGR